MGELLEQLHNKHRMFWSSSTLPASHRIGHFYFTKIVRDSNDHNCLPRLIHIHSSIRYWLYLLPSSECWNCLGLSVSHHIFFQILFNVILISLYEAFAQWPSSLFPWVAACGQYLQLCHAVLLSSSSLHPVQHISILQSYIAQGFHFNIQSSHNQAACSVFEIPGASLAWLSKAQLFQSRVERVWALVQPCQQLD